ncbi:MAG: STAS domain-containing protein [Planctomycetota bacterium]
MSSFSVSEVARGCHLLKVDGKLRGRRARQLGEDLEDFANAGSRRVVIDLSDAESLDSLAAFSLERGLELGLRLHLVVRPGFSFDGFFRSRSLLRRVAMHEALEAALATVRQVSESGMALV